MVKADTIFFPALTAELVILAKAVTAITSKPENLFLTVSTAFERGDILTDLAASPIFSKLLEEFEKFKLCFNLPIVPKLV